MKKLILSAIAVFAFTAANAQYKPAKRNKTKAIETEEATYDSFKPVKGTITTEVGITGKSLKEDFFALVNTTAKFRYFIKDDLAIRAGLGLGSRKEEENTILNQGLPSEYTRTRVARTTAREFTIGAEKHFTGTNRLSTYVGADIVFGFEGAEFKQTQSNNGDSTSVVGSTTATSVNGIFLNGAASSTFGVRATVGADYYFTKKLYLGVEIGLDYNSGTRDSVETTTVVGNTTTVTKTGEGKTSTTSTNTIGGLKLGFQF